MSRVCTICARGGSKGVAGKNLKVVAGRPLIAHTVEQARSSGAFDLIVADSDDSAILEAASAAGADAVFERPPELASDTAGKLPAIAHAAKLAEEHVGAAFDVIVDLDVTSPLRFPEDITNAIELLETSDADNVITGSPARRSPYFNLVEAHPDGSVGPSKKHDPPLLRRQDAPACFDMNASIYAWDRNRFLADPYLFDEHTAIYVMPPERSIDIDDELDFQLVQHLLTLRMAEAES